MRGRPIQWKTKTPLHFRGIKMLQHTMNNLDKNMSPACVSSLNMTQSAPWRGSLLVWWERTCVFTRIVCSASSFTFRMNRVQTTGLMTLHPATLDTCIETTHGSQLVEVGGFASCTSQVYRQTFVFHSDAEWQDLSWFGVYMSFCIHSEGMFYMRRLIYNYHTNTQSHDVFVTRCLNLLWTFF